MNIINVENHNQFPAYHCAGYALGEKDTLQDCIARYKAKYGVDPVTVYYCESQRNVRIELPEEAE